MRYRKVPVEIEAFRWEGDTEQLGLLLGWNWTRADARDIAWEHEDDGEQIVIYNSLEKVWIPCPIGYWIIRGLKGEFYPCEPEVFEQSYEAVE